MVSPDVFQIRNRRYPRIERYGTFCAEATEALLASPPETVNRLLERLTPQIREFYLSLDEDNAVAGFGRLRDLSEKMTTHGRGRFDDAIDHASGGKRKKSRTDINWFPPHWLDSGLPKDRFTLTSVITDGDSRESRIEHFASPEEDKTYNAEHIWSELSQAYLTAMDESIATKKRRTAAIEAYWLMSHYAPLERGSATAARIMLEFLAEHAGFETGPTKENCDLNIEALLSNKQTFLRKFDGFFDKGVASPSR